jgi:hypothetical protein
MEISSFQNFHFTQMSVGMIKAGIHGKEEKKSRKFVDINTSKFGSYFEGLIAAHGYQSR